MLGDSNIDHLQFNSSDIEKSRHKPLIKELCDKILPQGVKQCVTGFTHSRQGQRDTLLDVLYTNAHQKLSNVQAVTRGASDHKIISAVRHSKNVDLLDIQRNEATRILIKNYFWKKLGK